MTDSDLIQKAISIATEHPELNRGKIEFSSGWVRRFRERWGIVFSKTYGEAQSADPAAVREAQRLIGEWLVSYTPDNIFNEDETGMFINLEPSRTLMTEGEKSKVRGIKKQKERLTVALCSNMTGSVKMKPYIIGKSKNPRPFKNFKRDRYCRWNHN